MTTDLSALPKLLSDLYRTVKALETLAPGRRFTPDGHLVGSIGEAVAAYAYDLELLRASSKGHDAKTRDGKLVQIKLTQGQTIAISHNCEHLLVLRFDQLQGFVEVYNGPGQPVWDVVGGRADAGRQRQLSVARLRTIPCPPEHGLRQVREFPAILTEALEAAGVTFTNGDEPGVKLRKAEP